MLEVEVPGNLTADDLFDPGSTPIILNSVIADFECSYSMMSAVQSGMEDATWSTSGVLASGDRLSSHAPRYRCLQREF